MAYVTCTGDPIMDSTALEVGKPVCQGPPNRCFRLCQPMVRGTNTQLCRCHVKTDPRNTNACHCLPTDIHLQERAAELLWPTGLSLLSPAVGHSLPEAINISRLPNSSQQTLSVNLLSGHWTVPVKTATVSSCCPHRGHWVHFLPSRTLFPECCCPPFFPRARCRPLLLLPCIFVLFSELWAGFSSI